jgi:hypothetical protein
MSLYQNPVIPWSAAGRSGRPEQSPAKSHFSFGHPDKPGDREWAGTR